MTEEEIMITAVVAAVLFTLMVLAYYVGGLAILEKAGLRKEFREKCLFAVLLAVIIAVLTVVTYLITLAIKK
jgi:hypothetical protein